MTIPHRTTFPRGVMTPLAHPIERLMKALLLWAGKPKEPAIAAAGDELAAVVKAGFERAGNPVGSMMLDSLATTPAVMESPVRELLRNMGVDRDEAVLCLADRLLNAAGVSVQAGIMQGPVIAEKIDHVSQDFRHMTEDVTLSGNAVVGIVSQGNAPIHVGQMNVTNAAPTPPKSNSTQIRYLEKLIRKCDALDLAPIDEARGQGRDAADAVRLSEVFTTLYLEGVSRWKEQTVADAILHSMPFQEARRTDSNQIPRSIPKQEVRRNESKNHAVIKLSSDILREILLQTGKVEKAGPFVQMPVQAVEATGALQRLMILGRPGGGKSTLVNHMAIRLARRRLRQLSGKDYQGKIPEDFIDYCASADDLPGWPCEATLLPVRVILRHFVGWLTDQGSTFEKCDGEAAVWAYLRAQLTEWQCADFADELVNLLHEQGGAVFFDGLDEVREEAENNIAHRTRVTDLIRRFAEAAAKCRVIVTCRQYAYKANDGWRLPERLFPVVELDLFRAEQINAFARAWYRATRQWRDWTAKRCDEQANRLCEAIEAKPHLAELARYPLLLTLMAQIHGKDGVLPDFRAELYERTVKLLLAHWDNRVVHEESGSKTCVPGLVARLGISEQVLRQALERVALSAHERQQFEGGENRCADISYRDLRDDIANNLPGRSLDHAETAIAYIRDRAGLLHADANFNFSFPHRTFQEYLAATGIMRQGAFYEDLRKKLRSSLDWWREVFLLAAGSRRDTPHNVYLLINALLPTDPPESQHSKQLSIEVVRLASLAAEAMKETGFVFEAKKDARDGLLRCVWKRTQGWLLIAMVADKSFTPIDRVAAGNILNYIEDPRFSPEKSWLPHENDGFLLVPEGEFWMGADRSVDEMSWDDEGPRHRIWLSAYEISQYPVTVAQFRVFLGAVSGFSNGKRLRN